MVESFTLFVRTYVYWVGLILGFAIFPGYLLFIAGVTPVNLSLWLAPVAGLLLVVIDRPSTWETPLWRSWLIRVFSAGCATTMLIAYVSVSARYRSQHWIEIPLSLGLTWIAFTVVAGLMRMSHSARSNLPARTNRDTLRTYVAWTGIYFGIFWIPSMGLAAAGTLWALLPAYGSFLTGLVLLMIDPPRRWAQPRVVSLWIRLFASGAAAFLITATESIYRDSRTHEVFTGNWQDNLIFYMGAWVIYAAVAGVAYLMRNPSHEAYNNLSK